MSAVSWAAILGSVASVITAVAVLLAVLGVRVRVRDVQHAVKTANGDTIGERIDRVGDLSEAIETLRIDQLPWDGTERRNRSGT